MSRTVVIGSNSYIIPDAGDNPGWGEDLTEYFQGIADALEQVQGPADILTTEALLSNNQVSPANIPGLVFNTGLIQWVNVEYFIKRIYDSGSSITAESGNIMGFFDGTTFKISTDTTEESGVEITVTNGGIFQYTSSNLANHVSSSIKFKAKAIIS